MLGLGLGEHWDNGKENENYRDYGIMKKKMGTIGVVGVILRCIYGVI